MTLIIVDAVAVFFLAAAVRAGAGMEQTGNGDENYPVSCPQCGQALPCNCNQNQDISYRHHHHHDQMGFNSANQASLDNFAPQDHHHHHGDADGWN